MKTFWAFITELDKKAVRAVLVLILMFGLVVSTLIYGQSVLRVLDADIYDIFARLKETGFALPVIDSEIITVTYDNVFKLFRDLRGMGENNAILNRDKRPLTREYFMRVAQKYATEFSEEDGRIFASFEIIFMLGWSPHSSQQKPLKPGSAKNRLAEALGGIEHKTGEKAYHD